MIITTFCYLVNDEDVNENMKGLGILISGILICIAVYVGVFIGRNTTTDTLYISNTHASAKDEQFKPINLNSATMDDLTTLPGVGQKLAKAIIEYRDKYGDYVDVDELLDVEGMSNDLYHSIKKYVTVD